MDVERIKGASVVASDIAPGMVERGRQRTEAGGDGPFLLDIGYVVIVARRRG